jgi:betaine reductase
MNNKIKIVYYLNQFYGQVGGEEKADIGPFEIDGAVGPARAVAAIPNFNGEVVATIVCGDNYFAENIPKAQSEIVELIKKYEPDLVIAGPAFNSGRYGISCGAVCEAAIKHLGIHAITAMFEENPGVDLYSKDVIIVKSGKSATSMKSVIQRMLEIGLKLIEGKPLDLPAKEGYYPQGRKRNIQAKETGAQRAVKMLVAKLNGKPYQTEISLPKFDYVNPAPPIKQLSKSIIALVTDGGLFPKGNPDKIEPVNASKYGKYSIKDCDSLVGADYEVCHRGYDSTFVAEDPNRLVPVDVMKDLEREGKIGQLYPFYFATSGLMTTLDNSIKIGKEIGLELLNAGVHGAILTSA